jgi:hypothetical protein
MSSIHQQKEKGMNQTRIRTRMVATVLGVGLAAALIMGAGKLAVPSAVEDRVLAERVIPRVQIIQFNDSVARLDTATGELHLFTGDLRSPSSRGQWRLYANGVSGSSGYLELQQPRGVEAQSGLFLVDIVSGESWILTRRASRATWDHVPVRRR